MCIVPNIYSTDAKFKKVIVDDLSKECLWYKEEKVTAINHRLCKERRKKMSVRKIRKT